jgi:hypothetical protein
MTLDSIARKLGLSSAVLSDRAATRWIAALLALYALSFAVFYPATLTNTDETGYLYLAQLIVKGDFTVTKIDPRDGAMISEPITNYPPGTSILMAPWIALLGWRAAFLIPAISLLVAVLLTARWLRDEQRSPLFALLVLAFVPSLVLGRVAISDVPSTAVVALGLWLFWRGLDRGTPWWLAAGFVAGVSAALRPTNPAPFIPLFAGTVLRRETKCWALVVGGLAGLAAYFAAMSWVHGDALRSLGARNDYHLDLESLHERVALYGFGLLILVPGGFAFTVAYRGRRRPEVIASFLGFFALYLAQEYSQQGYALHKRLVLALRYLNPILPLVAFAMAESVPRWWRQRLASREGAARIQLERAGRAVLATGLIGLAAACIAVHPAFALWASGQKEIRDEIHRTVPKDQVFITNWGATRKFFPELDLKYKYLDRRGTDPERVPELVDRYGQVFIVLLDRTDSKMWQDDARESAVFMAALAASAELLSDRQVSSTDRLRIWQIRRGETAAARGTPSPR